MRTTSFRAVLDALLPKRNRQYNAIEMLYLLVYFRLFNCSTKFCQAKFGGAYCLSANALWRRIRTNPEPDSGSGPPRRFAPQYGFTPLMALGETLAVHPSKA